MAMTKRIELRECYIEGWYRMDAELLLAATARGFIFDDPAEPEPVTREMLEGYMQRWDRRTRTLGADNRWILSQQSRQEHDEHLLDWLWWQLVGTELQGAAVVLTGDDGVILERICYFDRNLQHPG